MPRSWLHVFFHFQQFFSKIWEKISPHRGRENFSPNFIWSFKQNKTVFKVHEKANKKIIKKNIEKLFKVNVIKVNIINQKSKLKIKQGKRSIKSGYKKAIVTLKKGQSIDLTTGI